MEAINKATQEKAETAEDAAFARFKGAAAHHRASEGVKSAEFQRIHRAFQAASTTYDEAHLRSKDAEIDVLRAQLAQRDAEIDLLMLQWGHSNQQVVSAVATASEAVSSAKAAREIPMFRSSDIGSTIESDDDA